MNHRYVRFRFRLIGRRLGRLVGPGRSCTSDDGGCRTLISGAGSCGGCGCCRVGVGAGVGAGYSRLLRLRLRLQQRLARRLFDRDENRLNHRHETSGGWVRRRGSDLLHLTGRPHDDHRWSRGRLRLWPANSPSEEHADDREAESAQQRDQGTEAGAHMRHHVVPQTFTVVWTLDSLPAASRARTMMVTS